MTRVLLVCPERLGHRHPAGVGIRFLEFARALRADGHTVEMLSPDAGEVEGCRSGPLQPLDIREATSRAEAVVVQGHATNELFAYGVERPTVVDLYDPYLVENFHYWDELGERVFRHDHATLLGSLRRGDLFLCASEAQRLFYTGLLAAAGRVNPALFAADPALESLLRIVPFGVQPPRRSPARGDARAIFFGAVYDWYDPMLAVDAVAIARRDEPALSLTFTHHPNAESTPQSLFARLREKVEREGSSFVRFEPWVAYDERGAFYDRFGLALLTFRPSLETDLAMRTRMFDCFWGGLPVVTSSAGGTDSIVERYGAGRVVRGEEPSAYAAAILELLRDRDGYERVVAGCEAFARDHQWPRLLEPLLAFCRQPRHEPTRNAFTVEVPELKGGAEPLFRRVRRVLRGGR
ncbi:MAG: glycosyltransferase family 4 protein [Thermoanaerobaculia bacterium]